MQKLNKVINVYKWICNDESQVHADIPTLELDGDIATAVTNCILPCPNTIECERDVKMLLAYFVITLEIGIKFNPVLIRGNEGYPTFTRAQSKHLQHLLDMANILSREHKLMKNIYELCYDLYTEMEWPF